MNFGSPLQSRYLRRRFRFRCRCILGSSLEEALAVSEAFCPRWRTLCSASRNSSSGTGRSPIWLPNSPFSCKRKASMLNSFLRIKRSLPLLSVDQLSRGFSISRDAFRRWCWWEKCTRVLRISLCNKVISSRQRSTKQCRSIAFLLMVTGISLLKPRSSSARVQTVASGSFTVSNWNVRGDDQWYYILFCCSPLARLSTPKRL